jgi:Lon protease-like protein
MGAGYGAAPRRVGTVRSMQELAVFPLDLVVFPGQTVPLVVFEARYKRLVQHLLELDEPRFVIARARRDGGAPFADVGTVVHVVELAERPDGTFTLTGHGRERVKATVARREDVPEPDGTSRPLYFTEERPLPLRRDDPNDERIAAWDALEAFRRYAATFFVGEAAEVVDAHVPEDLLYQASFVCANVRVEPEVRQTLLEAPSLIDRFRRAERLMDERVAAHAPARVATDGDAPA